MSHIFGASPLIKSLQAGEPALWCRAHPAAVGTSRRHLALSRLADAHARFERFAPALRALFPTANWDGRITSPFRAYAAPDMPPNLWVKCDHELPLTGTIKARGGVHEVIEFVEYAAMRNGLIALRSDYASLAAEEARTRLSGMKVAVGSTGNLGLSVGMVSRAFGMQAEVHMSSDAKAWKRERLRTLGVCVVEHMGDYSDAVAAARERFETQADAHFIDDEHSESLFVGYATAAYELADQLSAAGIYVTADQPLIIYLPCGVGGAPGGIAFGLKAIFGNNVRCIFVEPVASASMLTALAFAAGESTPVYEIGLDNRTVADGLATPAASQLVLDLVGGEIDAALALPDQRFLDWVKLAWQDAGLKLEPSAAAGFAAVHYLNECAQSGHQLALFDRWSSATHVVWTTGGAMLPEAEFSKLLFEPVQRE